MVATQQGPADDRGVFIYRDGKKEAREDKIFFVACHWRGRPVRYLSKVRSGKQSEQDNENDELMSSTWSTNRAFATAAPPPDRVIEAGLSLPSVPSPK